MLRQKHGLGHSLVSHPIILRLCRVYGEEISEINIPAEKERIPYLEGYEPLEMLKTNVTIAKMFQRVPAVKIDAEES